MGSPDVPFYHLFDDEDVSLIPYTARDIWDGTTFMDSPYVYDSVLNLIANGTESTVIGYSTTDIEDDTSTTENEWAVSTTEYMSTTEEGAKGTESWMVNTFFMFVIVAVVALALVIGCTFYICYRIVFGRSKYEKVNTMNSSKSKSTVNRDDEIELKVEI